MIKIKRFFLKNISNKYLNWLRNKEITKFTSIPSKINRSYLINYVRECNKDPKVFLFRIIYNNKHVGNLRISELKKNIATIGILIGEKQLYNKGIGTKAIKLAINFIKKKNFKKIYIFLNKKNCESQRIFEKNFFTLQKKIPKNIKLKRNENLYIKKITKFI